MQSECERTAREQAEHEERERFRGRAVCVVLEWNERGAVSVRHAGGHGVDADTAAVMALGAPPTPFNTVEVAQAEVHNAVGEYAFGAWARGATR